MEITIADFFPQQAEVKAGYETFFEGLQELVAVCEPDNSPGEALRRYVMEFLSECDLRDFDDFPEEGYGRVYLGRNAATGWEAIMMCWKQGSRTSIHGHPRFAAYNFASGRFRVETFEKGRDGTLIPADTFEAGAGEGFFAAGRAGTFDNHIHRITCLSGEGHSLHVYSDDARRGEVYDDVPDID